LRDQRYFESINYANLALGRYDVVNKVPPGEASAEPPWISWLGGLKGMMQRFGPDPQDTDLYFYIGEANRAMAMQMPLFIMQRRYFEAAVSAFQDGLVVFPQDENALIRQAQCMDGLHRYHEAEELYQRCFKLDPHLGTVFACYATHLLLEGNTTKAAAMNDIARALDSSEVDAEHKADNVLQ
jgi:tetratricopeptide (TPR) repeat protein